MIHVLHIIRSFAGDGPNRLLLSILREWNPDQLCVSLLSLSNQGPMRQLLEEQIERLGGYVYTGNISWGEPLGITHVHAHLLRPDRAGRRIAGELRAHYFITEHGIHSWSEKGRILRPAVKKWYLKTLPIDTSIIAISEKVQRDLIREGVREDLISVIPNGISTAEFIVRDKALDDSPVIAMIGSLIQRKSPLLAVKIMTELLKSHPKARLLVAGDGPLRGKLEALTDRLGLSSNVDFLGHCDPQDVYSRADLLLHPAQDEPFGLVVAEAMASGIPVVTRAGSGADELLPTGASCAAVDGDDSATWARAIRAVLENAAKDRRAVAESLRSHAIERFDIKRTSLAYLNLYK